MCALSCLISGQYPQFITALEKQGIKCRKTEKNPYLPSATAWHPDLQFLKIAPKTAFIPQGIAIKVNNYNIHYTKSFPNNAYPGDCLCNCLILQDMLFGNLKAIDPVILDYCKTQGIKLISVSQGYTKCSTLVVDQHSIITADPGIAEAAGMHGISVLKIQPGNIRLPGYNYGFIGGASGRVGNSIFFAGSLCTHSNATEIRRFIAQRNLSVVELTEEPLTDIGGIIEL